ncbi:MAG: ABC transporter ATP-binding protein [Legionellales bacterium]|nr:ABC transporter ATP-binding protein [Legionellales bacterium]
MNALEITHLNKTYKNGVVALKNIHLHVAQGEFFGLLGPNGAGKTTTLGIISSLVFKTSGHVSILGIDIDKNFSYAKTFLGIVPQEFNFNIFETPWQILIDQAGFYGVPGKIARVRAEEHLKRLGLWEKRKHASRSLSGGMKRRLMIARALMHNPQILILDEPTAGVDIEVRRDMWNYLQELNKQGKTIILTTHYLEEAESLCKRLAIIDHGEIIEQGLTKDLLQKLNVESFIFDVAKPIHTLPTIPHCEVELPDPHTLIITMPKSVTLNEIFAYFQTQQVDVISMRNKSNRLEELFVNLVNKHAA